MRAVWCVANSATSLVILTEICRHQMATILAKAYIIPLSEAGESLSGERKLGVLDEYRPRPLTQGARIAVA